MTCPVCAVCGNEVEPGRTQCPFCQSPFADSRLEGTGPLHRVVNLEKGMPLVQHALDRLAVELQYGKCQGVKVLTLIHGYGSSGTGGAIKTAISRQLQFLQHHGHIKDVVAGEEFESRSGRGRQLLRQFPFLARHRDLNRSNPGITLVVLSF